ncbi:hypothetical protein V8C35DRAFT_326202 [Trichoderma chlorosporum]
MSSDPVEEFQVLNGKSDFVFAIVYRGHWCPFCMAYVRSLARLTSSIVSAGGATLIVTAEAESFITDVRTTTGYTGDAISDPQNRLVGLWKEKDWVNVAITEKKGYEHGMAQPAILVLRKDETVIEKWAIVPTLMNMGGAKDRPVLSEVWDNVEAKLNGVDVRHKKYSLVSVMQVLRQRVFGPTTGKGNGPDLNL